MCFAEVLNALNELGYKRLFFRPKMGWVLDDVFNMSKWSNPVLYSDNSFKLASSYYATQVWDIIPGDHFPIEGYYGVTPVYPQALELTDEVIMRILECNKNTR